MCVIWSEAIVGSLDTEPREAVARLNVGQDRNKDRPDDPYAGTGVSPALTALRFGQIEARGSAVLADGVV